MTLLIREDVNLEDFNQSCCNSCTFKIYQKHLFSLGKTENLEISVFPIYYYLYLCQQNNNKKTAYQQTVLLKMILYVIIFIMYMIIIRMNLGLKFLLWRNGKCINFRKKKISYLLWISSNMCNTTVNENLRYLRI